MARVVTYSVKSHVAEIVLSRPQKLNAMGPAFFRELDEAVERAHADDSCRVVLVRRAIVLVDYSGIPSLSPLHLFSSLFLLFLFFSCRLLFLFSSLHLQVHAEGRAFTAGLDLAEAMSGGVLGGDATLSTAEKSARFVRHLRDYQRPFLHLSDKLMKPVICAIHGACVGGGVDLASACDVRLATEDAYFSIREVRVGLTADIGTLQRIGRIMNPSAANEMAFTGADYKAAQMKEWGFLSHIYKDKDTLLGEARRMAEQMAANSPLVLHGIKNTLKYARDHTVAESMEQIQLWNAAFIDSPDLAEAMAAFFEKRKPVFSSKL